MSSPKDDYVPLSSLPALLVHSCDGCSGTLYLDPSWETRIEASHKHFGGPYILCRKCQAKEDKREAAVVVQKGTRCRHKVYHSGPFSDLVVTAADGDTVTVAAIGLGGETEERTMELLRRCWPSYLLDTWPVFNRADLHMQGL